MDVRRLEILRVGEICSVIFLIVAYSKKSYFVICRTATFTKTIRRKKIKMENNLEEYQEDQHNGPTSVEKMEIAASRISLEEEIKENAAESNLTPGNEIEKNDSSCSLDRLPVEIFLHICSYLDAKFLSCTMRFVCLHFHSILSDEAMWKSRIGGRWHHVYPPLPVKSDKFSWMDACSLIEKEYNRWSRPSETMHCITVKDVHFASVDALLLINSGSLLVSGSRDHNLIAWSLENVDESSNTLPQVCSIRAHRGWIWNLAAQQDTIISCSFDSTAKIWQIGDEGFQELSSLSCKTAVLSLACDDNLIAAGLFGKEVNLYDPRTGSKFLSSYCAHKMAVLALAMTNDFIVSASEDKTISVWDRRAGKLFKTTIPFKRKKVEHSTPLCLSLDDNLLYVGDSIGQLHLINSSQGLFQPVMQCYLFSRYEFYETYLGSNEQSCVHSS